jgi:hypothetical protein
MPEGSYAARKQIATDAEWRSTTGAVRCWKPLGYQSGLLLPPIRRHINVRGDGSTGTFLQLTGDAVSWLKGADGGRIRWSMRMGPQREVPFVIRQAYTFMFYADITFVGLELQPCAERADDWFDLLHYARFLTDRAKPVTAECPAEGRPLDTLAQIAKVAAAGSGAQPQTKAELPHLGPLFDLLVDTLRLPGEDARFEQPGVPGQLLAYPVMTLAPLSEPALADLALVSRARGAHHARQDITSYGAAANTDGIMTYGRQSWFFASSEGGGFLGVVPEGAMDPKASGYSFARYMLPHHARTDYLVAYIFTAFQRFALIRLSDEIAPSSIEQADVYTAIYERVLNFTRRGLFAQISQSQHHHRFYKHAQAVHQVPELHDEVRQLVQAVREYQQTVDRERYERRSRAIEVLIGVVTGIVIPMQLVAALFPDSVSKWPLLRELKPAAQEGLALGAMAILVTLTIFGIRYASRPKHRKSDPP